MLTRRLMTLALATSLFLPGLAHALDPVFTAGGVAIRGADPVAYHVDSAYKKGSAEHTATYMGATWRFATAANRDRFRADPAKYAPQYGGYCAYAVSQGRTASIDPAAFTLVEGKLYLNYSLSIQNKWRADRDAYIAAADANWLKLRD